MKKNGKKKQLKKSGSKKPEVKKLETKRSEVKKEDTRKIEVPGDEIKSSESRTVAPRKEKDPRRVAAAKKAWETIRAKEREKQNEAMS